MQTPKYGARQIAIAQRAEIHVGLSDEQLRELAQHAVIQQAGAKQPPKAGA